MLITFVSLCVHAISIPHPHIPSLRPSAQSFLGLKDAQQKPLLDTLESWIEREKGVALERLLANISPGGRSAKGATKGSVIASPSREHPNYFYQCTYSNAGVDGIRVD